MSDRPITAIQQDILNRMPVQTFNQKQCPVLGAEIMVEVHDGQFVKRLHFAAMKARAELAETRVAELEAAITWALGAGEDFQPRPEDKGAYWWRSELQKRARLMWDGGKFIHES